VALILPEPDSGLLERYLKERVRPTAAKDDTGERRFTDKARALVEKHNIDLALLPVGRIIRERDVQALLAPKDLPDASTLPKTVVIYGASQGGLAVAECIRSTGEYELLAFLDDNPARIGKQHHGIPVWPGSDIEHAREKGIGGVATHIADAGVRYQLRDRAFAAGILPLNVIHAKAFVAPSARLGFGNLVKAGAIVDAHVEIGDCCIIDNGVILPHHNRIGSGCHVAPGACFGGDCEVGENTVIGIGAIVSARTRIGSNVIVGVGAVVARDIPDNAIVEGTPARVVGERK
jgi:sugar O-acyltransferase (sialic acid O-acetyltransferase NeuD family)